MKTVNTTMSMKPPVKTVSGAISEMKNISPSAKKEKLLAQLAEIETEEAAATERERLAIEAITAKRRDEYHDRIAEAELNEKLAIEASTAYDKNHHIKEALEIRKIIREEYAEFLPQPEELVSTAPETPIVQVRKGFAFAQVAAIVGILLFGLIGFFAIKGHIVEHNAAVAAGTAENNTAAYEMAYGLDSYQRIFYFITVACVLILSATGILYFVNPTIFKYTLSFFKTDPSAQSDFLLLTPWERQRNTTYLFLGLLLSLAILFSGKL